MSDPVCDRCHDRPAEIEFTDVSHGAVQEYHLCRQCAKELGAEDSISSDAKSRAGFHLSKLVAEMEGVETAGDAGEGGESRCALCGMTYGEFKKSGKLGCGECYHAFERELGPLLRRLHGRLTHGGRGPGESGAGHALQLELGALRKNLADAVAREAYEEAARIRDRIKELKNGHSGTEPSTP